VTDRELADGAWAELTQTTVGYINKKWKVPPAGTHWANAKALLDQIGVAPPPPPPPPPPSTGYASLVGTVSSDLALAASKGIKNVRIDIGFIDKAEIDTYRTTGGSVIPIACYNPWADLRPSGTGDHYAPDTDARRTAWAQRQVAAVQAKFTVPPEAIEVWNEPWLQGFWNAGPNPGDFLRLCIAFAVEAWKTWPTMKILVSADSGYHAWVDQLVTADTTGFLKDPRVFPTAHVYCSRQSPATVSAEPKDWDFQRYTFTYDAIKAHGHTDPQVYLTEFGWISQTAGGTGDSSQSVSEANQAQYHVDAYKIAKASGKVAKAYSYMLSPNQSWSYNWLRPDNSEKPVVGAVKTLIASG